MLVVEFLSIELAGREDGDQVLARGLTAFLDDRRQVLAQLLGGLDALVP